MSESIFGKGIQIAAGFDLGAQRPLDSRTVVNTFDELQEHIDGNRVYEGMTVYVIDEQKNYQFDGERWKAAGGTYYKGDVEPDDTDSLWIDTTTPSNLTETNHTNRIRAKLIKMTKKIGVKVEELQEKLLTVEERIGEISSDNVNKATAFRARLGDLRSNLNIVKLNLDSTSNSLLDAGQNVSMLKGASSSLRKEVKNLFYNLIDLDDEVIKLLENENNMIVQPDPDKPEDGGTDEPDTPTVVDGSAMLTEEGLMLMTEDGFILLLDGVINSGGSSTSEDSLLTESGLVLLTESGQQILRG